MILPNDAAFWAKRLAPYRKANNSNAVWQLVSTLCLFLATWIVMFQALKIGWWLSLLLAPLAGLFLIRLFIFQHDCGHGSFFTSKRANNTVGFFLGVFTLTPYHYWKRTHAIHHATSGNLDKRSHGDIDTLTVAEYLELTPMRRRMYRMYRNPLVLFIVGPVFQFFLKHRAPWDAPLAWRKEWMSVLMTNIVLLGDEFSGPSIDDVVRTVDELNTTGRDGKRKVRIHAIGFPTVFTVTGAGERTGVRFATLMRILCHRNDGTFVGLNSASP